MICVHKRVLVRLKQDSHFPSNSSHFMCRAVYL